MRILDMHIVTNEVLPLIPSAVEHICTDHETLNEDTVAKNV